jgi:orotidine-5'-phosphate decarboxylase
MTGLIVALDTPDLAQAEALAKELSGAVAALKVGSTLFIAHGPEAILEVGQHAPVFADLKLHDIPHQIEGAVAELARLGVWMLTVHASGGRAMVQAAVRAAATGAAPGGPKPVVAAVTVLTSLSETGLEEVGQGPDPKAQVIKLARLAVSAGAGALVCSPHEIAPLREALGPGATLVVPGIRPAGADPGDQARVMTPAEAKNAGADFIVVGRPVAEAPDPAAAAAAIRAELGD